MATYYVDAHAGSDSNTGLSAGSAWRTVEQVNRQDFEAGDTILFHAGDSYSATLIPSSSGTAAAPITFGAYGSGPAPVFDGGTDVSDAAWTRESTNVWSVPVAKQGYWPPQKVLFDGEAGNIASARVSAVDQPGDWFWSGGKLYVYSTQNPATAFDSVDVNVRDYGILLDGVSHVRVQGLEVALARQNVLVRDSSNVELKDLLIHDSVRDGVHIQTSDGVLVSGGASWDNGILGLPGNMTHLGHGVLFGSGTTDSIVEGMRLYGNTEDGVQIANNSGSGNVVRDNIIYENLEDGIDIKNGSQTLSGNEIHDNGSNAVLLHNTARIVTLIENHIRASAGGNALEVSEGARVLSQGNWYEGDDASAMQLQPDAGSASSFRNDVFVDGRNTSVSVSIEGGSSHTFDQSTFVVRDSGYAVSIEDKASGVLITHSIFYGEDAGLLRLAAAGLVALDDNIYWTTVSDTRWVRIDGSDGKGSAWLLARDSEGIVGDPRFVDADANDFTLISGSPATGYGAILTESQEPVPVDDGAFDNVMIGTAGADRIVGRSDNDHISGLAGDDELKGGDGADLLEGGEGRDRLHGGGGDDILVGGKGDDILIGWAGADTFAFGPGAGRDIVKDFAIGADTIDLVAWDGLSYEALMSQSTQIGEHAVLNFADGSRITLERISLDDLGAGNFRLSPGTASQTLPASEADAPAAAGASTGGTTAIESTLAGTSGDDRIVGRDGNEHILGHAGDDELKGGEGDDLLEGGAGADRLHGGGGGDILVGGAGADILIVWAGADTFVFRPGSGKDVVKDFETGIDKVDLSAFALDGTNDIFATAIVRNGNTEFTLPSGEGFRLDDVLPDELSPDDFVI